MKISVSFVGSGPGDPELLTLKAINRLKNADVILFDDLSSGPVLEYVKPEADLISVGKRAGLKSPKQIEVSRLLVEYASKGLKVVRLKSGDSCLFGRLEEELTVLNDSNITYEIIPGVTSALASAAAIGIPLTRRINSRRVQFITGHDINGDLPKDLNFSALSDINATTVVFMGRRTFSKLGTKLIEHGLSKNTPVVVAESISTENEKLLRTTIGDLVNLSKEKKQNVKNPAIIIYGPLLEFNSKNNLNE